MTLALWLGFWVAAVIISVTPGPGAVLSMSSGVNYGYRAALKAILGLQVAILLHLIIVAVGFGALLQTSEVAFNAVKLIGSIYLLWIGFQKWREPVDEVVLPSLKARPRHLFQQGLLVNLTNPKAILFIAALVPQFIDMEKPLAMQYLTIAGTLCMTDIMVMSIYALAAVRLGGWLRQPKARAIQNQLFGSMFVVAGAFLATASHR